MRILAAAMAVLALMQPAKAEFRISTEGAPPSEAGQPGPIRLFSDKELPTSARVRQWRIMRQRQVLPRASANAEGFGRQVPLAFAIRQIVPPKVKVVLADDVSLDDLVDWDGGRAWIEALRDAVRPISLCVTVTPMTVSISRA